MSAEIKRVVAQQAAWARQTSRPVREDGKALARPADALFAALDPRTKAQLKYGAGGELNRLHSLRSSTALVLNVFHPWKDNVSGIAAAIGKPGDYSSMSFERPYPTGASSRHPHLDVVMEGETPRALAVESKFLEIYDEPRDQVIQTSYTNVPHLWKGLERTRAVAESIGTDVNPARRLGSAQLVKHVLGLSQHYGHQGFGLIYLWYEIPGTAAWQHRQELKLFGDAISQEVDFTALTYQDLYSTLADIHEPAPGYIDYLAGRYFSNDR